MNVQVKKWVVWLSVFLLFVVSIPPTKNSFISEQWLSPVSRVQLGEEKSVYIDWELQHGKLVHGKKLGVFKPTISTSRKEVYKWLQKYGSMVVAPVSLTERGGLKMFGVDVWKTMPKYKMGPNKNYQKVLVVVRWNEIEGKPVVSQVFDVSGEEIYPFKEYLIHTVKSNSDEAVFVAGCQDSLSANAKIMALSKGKLDYRFVIQKFTLDINGGLRFLGEKIWPRRTEYESRNGEPVYVTLHIGRNSLTEKPQVQQVYDADGKKIYPLFSVYVQASLNDQGKRIGGHFLRGFHTAQDLWQKSPQILKQYGEVVIEDFLLNACGRVKLRSQPVWSHKQELERGWIEKEQVQSILNSRFVRYAKRLFESNKNGKLKFKKEIDEVWLRENSLSDLIELYRLSQLNVVTLRLGWNEVEKRETIIAAYSKEGRLVYTQKEGFIAQVLAKAQQNNQTSKYLEALFEVGDLKPLFTVFGLERATKIIEGLYSLRFEGVRSLMAYWKKIERKKIYTVSNIVAALEEVFIFKGFSSKQLLNWVIIKDQNGKPKKKERLNGWGSKYQYTLNLIAEALYSVLNYLPKTQSQYIERELREKADHFETSLFLSDLYFNVLNRFDSSHQAQHLTQIAL